MPAANRSVGDPGNKGAFDHLTPFSNGPAPSTRVGGENAWLTTCTGTGQRQRGHGAACVNTSQPSPVSGLLNRRWSVVTVAGCFRAGRRLYQFHFYRGWRRTLGTMMLARVGEGMVSARTLPGAFSGSEMPS